MRSTSPLPGIESFLNQTPTLAENVWVHASAVIIGNVEIGESSSVWCGSVVRGDVNSIRIGARSNVQDNSVLHVSHAHPADPAGAPLIIGDDVTIGHSCILHGCIIGDRVLVGMGSLVMDHAQLEPDTILGAGSLVPEGKRLESGWLYLGRPAKPVRRLTDEEKNWLRYSAEHYVKLAASYQTGSTR